MDSPGHTPGIGRIVIFVSPEEVNGTREHPAIVTRVWNGGDGEPNGLVNLQVFLDARGVAVETSVEYAAPEASFARRSWHWPPRG